jgi:hypothetical protein
LSQMQQNQSIIVLFKWTRSISAKQPYRSSNLFSRISCEEQDIYSIPSCIANHCCVSRIWHSFHEKMWIIKELMHIDIPFGEEAVDSWSGKIIEPFPLKLFSCVPAVFWKEDSHWTIPASVSFQNMDAIESWPSDQLVRYSHPSSAQTRCTKWLPGPEVSFTSSHDARKEYYAQIVSKKLICRMTSHSSWPTWSTRSSFCQHRVFNPDLSIARVSDSRKFINREK